VNPFVCSLISPIRNDCDKSHLMNNVFFLCLCRANIDEVETDVVEIEAKLDKVRIKSIWNNLVWKRNERTTIRNIMSWSCPRILNYWGLINVLL